MKDFDPILKLLCLANVQCRVIFVQYNMIKTFDPFGSLYLSKAHERTNEELYTCTTI
jgi:hypothetical protein